MSKPSFRHTALLLTVFALCACSVFSRRTKTQAELPSSPPPAAASAQEPLPTPQPPTPATPVAPTTPPAWSYEGDQGPEHWADLNPDFNTCREGREQSPIDLKWHKPAKGGAVSTEYQAMKARVVDNGHTAEVDFEPGNVLRLHGRTYTLVNAHFHAPSEHSLSSRHLPMEVHLVHKDAEGHIAVVATFFKIGGDSAAIAKIWQAALATTAETVIDPKGLVPATMTHYEYKGSLTTPPCTEDVEWVVFNTPLSMSKAQLETFQKSFTANARPPQPLNGRTVVNY